MVKADERLWLNMTLDCNYLWCKEMELPVLFVFGIKWKCEVPLRV